MESANAVGYFRVLGLEHKAGMTRGTRYLHPQPWPYHMQMEAVAAFVLAGGKSSRMGSDKALLELGGLSLLQRAVELASTVANDVKIVGDPAKYRSFGRVVPDVYADRGPLGGVHAALANTITELNLILATDLPFVEPAFLQQLIMTAQACDALVTVPHINGYFEPLCAVYRKEFCDVAGKALAERRNKVDALFSPAITRIVTKEEIVRAGLKSTMFRNLNTPDDFALAKQELSL